MQGAFLRFFFLHPTELGTDQEGRSLPGEPCARASTLPWAAPKSGTHAPGPLPLAFGIRFSHSLCANLQECVLRYAAPQQHPKIPYPQNKRLY